MFTGIVQSMGTLMASDILDGDKRMQFRCDGLDPNMIALGDSVAVSGVCLTAVAVTDEGFDADVSMETLELTTLGNLAAGSPVNLELALTPSSRLGGHLMSGHVDGLARLLDRYPDGRSERFEFEVPGSLARFVAAKGSVALDGVSLTVNAVKDARFGINLIPHTLENTTLGRLTTGQPVNLEVDILARYVARLHEHAGAPVEDLLKDHGFA